MSTVHCPLSTAIRSALAVGAASALLLGAAFLPACAKPLLSPSDERTPFDRYDNVRTERAPQYIENEYGRREPNLRGRLSPKD